MIDFDYGKFDKFDYDSRLVNILKLLLVKNMRKRKKRRKFRYSGINSALRDFMEKREKIFCVLLIVSISRATNPKNPTFEI